MAVAAQALSVDHLEVMTPETMKSLHGSNTIATLLPSCSYFLGIPYGPARELIENDTIVALATRLQSWLFPRRKYATRL